MVKVLVVIVLLVILLLLLNLIFKVSKIVIIAAIVLLIVGFLFFGYRELSDVQQLPVDTKDASDKLQPEIEEPQEEPRSSLSNETVEVSDLETSGE